MTCDAERFHVTVGGVHAYEGEACPFAEDLDVHVPRDLV